MDDGNFCSRCGCPGTISGICDLCRSPGERKLRPASGGIPMVVHNSIKSARDSLTRHRYSMNEEALIWLADDRSRLLTALEEKEKQCEHLQRELAVQGDGGSHRATGHREATDDSAMVGASDSPAPTVVREPFYSAEALNRTLPDWVALNVEHAHTSPTTEGSSARTIRWLDKARSRLVEALEQEDAKREDLVKQVASTRQRAEAAEDEVVALQSASVLQKEELKWLSENMHCIRAEGGGYHYYVRPWITYRGYDSLDDLIAAERAND